MTGINLKQQQRSALAQALLNAPKPQQVTSPFQSADLIARPVVAAILNRRNAKEQEADQAATRDAIAQAIQAQRLGQDPTAALNQGGQQAQQLAAALLGQNIQSGITQQRQLAVEGQKQSNRESIEDRKLRNRKAIEEQRQENRIELAEAQKSDPNLQFKTVTVDGKERSFAFNPQTGELGKELTVNGKPLGRPTQKIEQTNIDDPRSGPQKGKRFQTVRDKADAAKKSLGTTFDMLSTATAGTTGLRGATGQLVGGAIGQISQGAGDEVTGFISGTDAEALQTARTRQRLTIAQNLSTITGEESGRFTDRELAIAEDALGTLKKGASIGQIRGAASVVAELDLRSLMRAEIEAGDPLTYDLTTADGVGALFDKLTGVGLSEDRAKQILETVRGEQDDAQRRRTP